MSLFYACTSNVFDWDFLTENHADRYIFVTYNVFNTNKTFHTHS